MLDTAIDLGLPFFSRIQRPFLQFACRGSVLVEVIANGPVLSHPPEERDNGEIDRAIAIREGAAILLAAADDVLDVTFGEL